MSPFTVVWGPDEVSRLTEFWINSGDRMAITAAAAKIDRLLRDDPIANGVPIKEGLWGLDQPPLRVLFSINEDARVVEIALVKIVVE